METAALTVTDGRTGKQYSLPIENGTIRARDLRQIKVSEHDFGLMSYDPGLMNTASCKSRITFIDGERGILRYRGYPIEQLAKKSSYLEVAYLLVHGELPTCSELEEWKRNITYHTFVRENIEAFMEGFHHDAPPMGMLISTLGALSTFYPDASFVLEESIRREQTYRLIGKIPTLAAYAYRRSRGLRNVYPNNDLSYAGNFLNMMFRTSERKYRPDTLLERALDVLFILHADHEQHCSANVMRSAASSQINPYFAVAAAAAAFSGPLHGRASSEVIFMLNEIGSKARLPGYLRLVKAGAVRLMGFGHRIYKNYDPRSRILKQIADEVFEATARSRLLDIALELERITLEDDYFVERKLYPNVDFYSGLIYQAINFPVDMFPVLSAIPRTSGWLAQWEELVHDPEQKLVRPRQVYVGEGQRDYLPMEERRGQTEHYATTAVHR
jgi:citrate synthase